MLLLLTVCRLTTMSSADTLRRKNYSTDTIIKVLYAAIHRPYTVNKFYKAFIIVDYYNKKSATFVRKTSSAEQIMQTFCTDQFA